METFVPQGKLRGMIMPDYIESKNLCVEARYLYAVLCDYARDKDHCWPSQRTLARRIGCSIASLKKYLRQLVAEKLIWIEHALRGCKYYLLNPVQTVKKISQKVSKFDGYPSNFDTESNLNNKKENTPPPLPHSSSLASKTQEGKFSLSESKTAFTQIWALYPKHECETRARNVWNKLWRQKKLPELSVILSAIQRQKRENQSWQRENGRFVPLLHNWLKDGRWTDMTPIQKATEDAYRQMAIEYKKRQKERTDLQLSVSRIQDEEFNVFANRLELKDNVRRAAYAIICYARQRGINIDIKTYNINSCNILSWLRRNVWL